MTKKAKKTAGLKRGRKLGVKVGPYKPKNLTQMYQELKELRAKVAKLERMMS